jgi:hypothetical protein
MAESGFICAEFDDLDRAATIRGMSQYDRSVD